MFIKVCVFITTFSPVKAIRRSFSFNWNLYFCGVGKDLIVVNYLSNLTEIGHLCKIALGNYVGGVENQACQMGLAFGNFWSKSGP